jgi:hypothetical protein
VVVEGDKLYAERGSGKFIARGVPAPLAAAGKRDGPASVLRKLIG